MLAFVALYAVLKISFCDIVHFSLHPPNVSCSVSVLREKIVVTMRKSFRRIPETRSDWAPERFVPVILLHGARELCCVRAFCVKLTMSFSQMDYV